MFSQETHEVRPFRRINWHVIEGRYRIKLRITKHNMRKSKSMKKYKKFNKYNLCTTSKIENTATKKPSEKLPFSSYPCLV